MTSDWGNEKSIELNNTGDRVLEGDLTSRVSEETTIGEGDARRWTESELSPGRPMAGVRVRVRVGRPNFERYYFHI